MAAFDLAILIALGVCLLSCLIIAFWKDSPAATFINSGAQRVGDQITKKREHLTPASRYVIRPVFAGLQLLNGRLQLIQDGDQRAAVLVFSVMTATLATVLFVYYCVELAYLYPGETAIILLALAPLFVGVCLSFWGAPTIISSINSRSESAGAYHSEIKARETKFARYGLRPATWGFKRIHDLTERIEDQALRAGARLSAWIYWAAIVLICAAVSIAVAVEVVLGIAVVIIALLIIGAVAGSSGSVSGGSSYGGRSERITRRETNFWGEPRDVIYEDGKKVGEARVEERGGFFGIGAEKVKVEYDASGNEVGTIRQEERGGILGIGAQVVQVHYDADGHEIAQTHGEERGGILGIGARPVSVTYNQNGEEVSQSEWEDHGGVLGIGAERVKVTRKTNDE